MMPPINILVIEDAPADFLLLKRHLQRHQLPAVCRRVDNAAELAQALQSDWDVVLSDFNVPGLDFRRKLERIRRQYPLLPVIMVSGGVGEETAVDLLRLGMNDFVLKDNLLLVSVIRRVIDEARERRALREAEAVLQASQQQAIGLDPRLLTSGEGRFIAVNRPIAELKGMQPEAFIGKTDFEVWPQELAARYHADDRRVIESRRPIIVEEPMPMLPGSLYETVKAPIIDADGSVLGTVGFVRDVKPQRTKSLIGAADGSGRDCHPCQKRLSGEY